jgi:hypothetical protein
MSRFTGFIKNIRKISWIVAGLILADHLMKILAWNFLSPPVFENDAPVQFHKILNNSGFGYGQREIFEAAGVTSIHGLIVLSTLFFILSGVSILVYSKLPFRKSVKIGVYLLFFGVLLTGITLLFPVFQISLPERMALIIRGAGPLFLAAVLFFKSENSYSKVLWGLLLAGNAGNYLSFFYPPFAVVDFIGLSVFHPENTVYYNLADFYLIGFIPLLAGVPVYWLIKTISRRFAAKEIQS